MTLSCSLTSRTICLLVSSLLGWPRARPLDAHFSLMARTSSFAASSSPSVGRLAAHYSGRPVALPFVAVVQRRHIRVFFDIVLTVFATVGRLLCLAGSGRCPSTRSCSPVSRTSIFSTSPSPSLRRLATNHVGPRLGALPFGAQLFTGFTGERHFGIVLTSFATVGHPPCWVGSGRGPMALSCSLASRMSSLLASSPLSVCRPLCSVGLWLCPSPRSCSLASRT